jgi:hypothetical protein
MLVPYRPKINEIIVALACDTPEAAGADDTHVVPFDVNTLPFVPEDVNPVPPFAAIKVPAKVIAPVVDVLGVKPVDPALNDVTPPVDAAHDAVVPLDVKTYPFVPIASRVALLVPLPRIRSPVVVIGESALNAAEAVV